MAGYGCNRSRLLIIGSFWLYAGILEYPSTSLPVGIRQSLISRHPRWERYAAGSLLSSSGAGDPAFFLAQHRLGRDDQFNGSCRSGGRRCHRAETNDEAADQIPHQSPT
jgi:hypothetical protein